MSVITDIEELASYEKMKNAWWNFHQKNEHIYDLFDEKVRKSITSLKENKLLYKKSVPLRMIFESIRLDLWIKTITTDQYKINNNHFKFYAFLWQQRNPQYAGIFSHRGYVPEKIRKLIEANAQVHSK